MRSYRAEGRREEQCPEKVISPNVKYRRTRFTQSTLVTKFVNSMMWGGKKSTAQGIFYEAMTNLEQKGGDEALKLFKKAVENCKPLLEVKSRRVWRRELPGADRSAARTAYFACDSLAGILRPFSR